MNREQRRAIVEVHNHVSQAYKLFMSSFKIADSELLNMKANADLETMLLESANVFDILLKNLNEIPKELSDQLEKAYKDNDEAAVQEVERKIEEWK